MRYRVFVQDVGESGYSGVRDITAKAPYNAITKWVNKYWPRYKFIALPHSRKDLWPHKTTGAVPTEALQYK